MPRKKFIGAVLTIFFALSFKLPHIAIGQVGNSAGLVNPDLASEKELLALPHMNAALVKSVIEQRPYLNMASLHALLAKALS